MKKSTVKIILLVLLGIAVLSLLAYGGCRMYKIFDFYFGYNYEYPLEGTWVCEEPYIVYEGIEADFTVTFYTIESESDVVYQLGNRNRYMFIDKNSSDYYHIDRVLTGTYVDVDSNTFYILVDKESDKLFGGKYKKLVFVKQDSTDF